MAKATLAQAERADLCDLLVELGPDAPTLCEGWTTADLAAHLVVRERRPDSGPGLVWAPLSAYTEKVRRAQRQRTPFDQLVAKVRSGPPRLLGVFDAAMNTVEYFIHHEDVRRGQVGWAPRDLSDAVADALWDRLGPSAMAKAVPATIILESPGRASKRAGTGPEVICAADPGELTMFASGRQGAAWVDLTGDAALTEQLRNAALGV